MTMREHLIFFLTYLIIHLIFVSSEQTSFVNKDSKLVSFNEQKWYKNNIPFVEVPDKNIEEIYYYRWASHKRHLRYLHPGTGYSVTEFINDVSWQAKYGTINDAAGHHIYESRWIKDQTYIKDYINFFARQSNDGSNHHFSEWIADAAYNAYLVNGDKDFITSQLEGLIKIFEKWGNHFEPKFGLYFISPSYDAQEYSAASVQTSDKHSGGLGYRPSFNSEMYANAIAISKIAKLKGDTKTEADFTARAKALREAILTHLWDKTRHHFYHIQRNDNPNNSFLDTREEVGFYPWRWQIPDNRLNFSIAWEQLYNPQGFDSKYGPTTCEMTSKWFDGKQKNPQCCFWNGNSWPYSTSHILNSLAAQIRHYKEDKAFIDAEHYVKSLHKYAITQYKNNVPYVAECHSPEGDFWVCDSRNHSEHYAHSTYTDNILFDLIGILPRDDDKLEVDPIIPSSWKYFIAENVPYHGHEITVLYDQDGSKYKVGAGLKVYVNGKLSASQDSVGKMIVDIPKPVITELKAKRLVNYAVNIKLQGYPKPIASFTSSSTSPWQAIDGRIFYDYIPSNRWFDFNSKHDEDWFGVDFGREKTINSVSIYVYDDRITKLGQTECPAKMNAQYHDGKDWVDAHNQVSTPAKCAPNDVNQISFTSVKTRQIRVIFTRNKANGDSYVGITEFEVWAEWPQTPSPNIYEVEDGIISDALIEVSDTASGKSFVGGIDKRTSSVELSGIYVANSGNTKIKIYYANAGTTPASQILIVNNLHTITVHYPSTKSGWGRFNDETFVEITVPLIRGNNALLFEHSENFAELDKIELIN